MIIAQITDTHIKGAGRKAYGRVDTVAFMEETVAHINAMTPAVDAVIVTGDIADSGEDNAYEIAGHNLDRLNAPWFAIPGNHDDRDAMRRVFASQSYLKSIDGFLHYSIDDFPIRLVGVDTTEPMKPHGFLCERRLEWLDSTLSIAPDTPTLVFQHHPPFDTGIEHMDRQSLLNGKDEISLLSRHPQVRHVACGHVHRACETTIDGVAVSIAPNGAHSVTLDLSKNGAASFSMDPPSVRLFFVTPVGSVVSHLSFIGNFDGPFPFYAADGSLLD